MAQIYGQISYEAKLAKYQYEQAIKQANVAASNAAKSERGRVAGVVNSYEQNLTLMNEEIRQTREADKMRAASYIIQKRATSASTAQLQDRLQMQEAAFFANTGISAEKLNEARSNPSAYRAAAQAGDKNAQLALQGAQLIDAAQSGTPVANIGDLQFGGLAGLEQQQVQRQQVRQAGAQEAAFAASELKGGSALTSSQTLAREQQLQNEIIGTKNQLNLLSGVSGLSETERQLQLMQITAQGQAQDYANALKTSQLSREQIAVEKAALEKRARQQAGDTAFETALNVDPNSYNYDYYRKEITGTSVYRPTTTKPIQNPYSAIIATRNQELVGNPNYAYLGQDFGF